MPKIKVQIDVKRLIELLTYDPFTGVFRWRNDAGRYGRIKAGTIAGNLNGEGYRYICIDGQLLAAHRLAWAYMMGFTPPRIVDHRDGNLDNNSFFNLRLATDGQSMANRTHKNKHGAKGVSTKRDLYRARIYHGGKSIHIGYYATPEEAHAAYVKKSLELQGDFSIAARKGTS